MAEQPDITTQMDTAVTPLPKLETKLKTISGLLCDTVYDHLIYTVQENSSGQQYRHKLKDFLGAKQTEFFTTYVNMKYKPKPN
jgi:hypothetical protein